MYGNLCCDWSTSSEGDKSCQQRVTRDGVCLCGGEGGAEGGDGTPASIPAKIPVEVRKTAAPKEHKKDDDWNNDNWKPWGGWEPMV